MSVIGGALNASPLAIVFTDIVGSTTMNRSLGDVRMGAIKSEHQSAIDDHASEEGGMVLKWKGDGVVATFPSVEAAIRFSLKTYQQPGRAELADRIRIGIHFGGVTHLPPNDAHPKGDIDGNEANYAARIEAACGGAGVMISDDAWSEFLRICGESQTNFHPTQFDGIPLKGFPGFHKVWRLAGPPADFADKWHARVTELICEIRVQLEMGQELARGMLIRELELESELSGHNEAEKFERLMGRLLSLEVKEALDLFHSFRVRPARYTPAEQSMVPWLTDFMHRLLPVLFDPEHVDALLEKSPERVKYIHVSLVTAAELLMAAYDGRQASYNHRKIDGDFPAGTMAISHAVERGIDESGEQRVANLHAHLSAKFQISNAANFRKVIFAFLCDKLLYLPPEMASIDDGAKNNLVKDRMCSNAGYSDPSYYLLFSRPDDPGQRMILEEAIKDIQREYEHLVCLVLESDQELFREESNLYEPLRRMIPLKA